jgi:hypothetical protein
VYELKQVLLRGIFGSGVSGRGIVEAEDIPTYQLEASDWSQIQQISAERYSTWDWNYGHAPKFNIQKSDRFPAGVIDARMDVEGGTIRGIRIYGDFSGERDVIDLEEQLVAMNTDRNTRFVAPAMAFALPQHALYQNNGNRAFPEPIASTISHWYRARILDRLPYYHNDEMTSNFFDTEARFVWTVGEQEPFQSWNPEGNVSSIGDFIDYATAAHGNEILLETDGQVWAEIEGEWRTALRVELTGRSTPTTGWKIGIAIIVIVMVGGIGLAIGSVIHSRRTRQRPETEAPIPGFFVDE